MAHSCISCARSRERGCTRDGAVTVCVGVVCKRVGAMLVLGVACVCIAPECGCKRVCKCGDACSASAVCECGVMCVCACGANGVNVCGGVCVHKPVPSCSTELDLPLAAGRTLGLDVKSEGLSLEVGGTLELDVKSAGAEWSSPVTPGAGTSPRTPSENALRKKELSVATGWWRVQLIGIVNSSCFEELEGTPS